MLSTPFAEFTYHPYQAEAIEWMKRRETDDATFIRGGILADEMGLGKTWETIGLLLNSPASRTLLVLPPVLQPQWIDALTKSNIPHSILQGGNKYKHAKGTREMSIVITTYERCARSATLLKNDHFDRIICDEGHMLRNGPKTHRFREIASIPALRRWILSGTPIQNQRVEFKNLLEFLGMDNDIYMKTPTNVLANEIILRRVVDDVRDVIVGFPETTPKHLTYPVLMPPDSEESRVFAALVGRMEYAIEQHAAAALILELYLRIRQFIAHPAIYTEAVSRKFGNNYGRKLWTGTASKMTAFHNFLATAEKTPTIVFGNFLGELDLAETELRRAGYTVWSIRGGMTDAARTAAIEGSKASAESGEATASVIQIVTGGAGLNLQHCSRICFLSSHWNPAVVDQAIARAYRMGQTKPVDVIHFLLADDAERNLDRRIANMHTGKRLIAAEIHPKLVCDSAPDTMEMMTILDNILHAHAPTIDEDPV